MELIYFNGEIFAINLEEAKNEDLNSLLDWIEEQEK